MKDTVKKKVLIVIGGPTAVGKTSVSIALAKEFNTHILSTDSRQLYRELSVGTAKPTRSEISQAPHHFIDHISIGDFYSAGIYEREALDLLEQLFTNQEIVIAVGGSGLYANALTSGLNDMPDISEEIRNEALSDWKEKGLEWLQEQVAAIDPEYFSTTDIQNPRRLLRALEIFRSTGKAFSSFRTGQTKSRDFEIIWIGLDLPREELFDRINRRVDQMVEEGLVEEFEQVKQHRGHNALKTVGYQELFNYEDGIFSLEEAIEKIKVHTRRYAKRQITWFRKIPGIEWFSPTEINEIIQYLKKKIN